MEREEKMGFLIFLGICVVLAINYFIAYEFYRIAVMKGHDDDKYLWISFLFAFAGYMLVIALPDRSDKNVKIEKNTVDEIPEL